MHPSRQNTADRLVGARLFHPGDQPQLMIARAILVMPNLRSSSRGKDMCVQCNMNFFSSSRKIFAPV
jgi:hypothetical protein